MLCFHLHDCDFHLLKGILFHPVLVSISEFLNPTLRVEPHPISEKKCLTTRKLLESCSSDIPVIPEIQGPPCSFLIVPMLRSLKRDFWINFFNSQNPVQDSFFITNTPPFQGISSNFCYNWNGPRCNTFHQLSSIHYVSDKCAHLLSRLQPWTECVMVIRDQKKEDTEVENLMTLMVVP